MILLLLLLTIQTSANQCFALVSEQTPGEVLEGLAQGEDRVVLLTLEEWSGESWTPVLVFDFLYDHKKSLALREAVDCSACIVNGNPYWLENAPLFPSMEHQYGAITALLKSLSIPEVLLLHSPPHNVPFRGEIQSSALQISRELSNQALELLARRLIKARSVRALVLCMEGDLALRLLLILQMSRLDYPITILLTQTAAWFDRTQTPDLPGRLLFLANRNCELADSMADSVTCLIHQRIAGFPDTSLSVLQLRPTSQEVVGSLDQGQTSLCVKCLKLIPVPPAGTRIATLQFSFNNGTTDPTGAPDSGEAQYYLGAELAVADINQSSDLLPFSSLRIFNVSLGLFEFDQEWVRKQLAGVTTQDLGIAFLHGHYSNVAIPLYSFLTGFNFTNPQFGADNSSPLLSAPTFSHYARVTISSSYTGVMFVHFIQQYGWTRFSLLGCDDLYCVELVRTLEQAAAEHRLEIVNNASTRILQTNATSYLPVLEDLVASKVRVVVLVMYGSLLNFCLETLYDLGMRRGDLIFLPVMWLVPDLFQGTEKAVHKRKEMLNGALQIYPATFLGPLGRDIQERFQQIYREEPAHFVCTNYDAVLLLAHALDYLRAIGAAYEETSVLSQQLRKARFTGCTGEVSLQEGERLPSVFDIQNAVIRENGEMEIVKVGLFKPLSTVLFSFSRNITWPDGTDTVPGDMRINPLDCPFEPKDIRKFWPAEVLEGGSITLLALLGLLSTAVIWRRCWQSGATAMHGRAEISLDDYLLFAAIGVEGVQYCFLGPALQQWSFEAQRFLVFVRWDLQRLFVYSHQLLMISVCASLGAVGLWAGLLLAAALGLKCTIAQWSYHLLPHLGNVSFVPIVFSLLSLMQCGQAATTQDTPGFTDTFLLEDCYLQCWEGCHLGLTIAGLLALATYVPSAVYLRPKWQEVQPTLHIPVSPAHLMVKSLYQLLIASSQRGLNHRNALAHSILFFILTTAYFAASVLRPAYGYGRANLWHLVSIWCVLWYSLVMMVSTYVSTAELVWAGLLIAGLGLVTAGAVLLQFFCLPPLLYRKKGISVVDLFRFQFSKEPQAHQLFAKKVPTVSPTDVTVCVTSNHLL